MLLAIVIVADLVVGGDVSRMVMWGIRVPRVATALIVGASLSLAGVQMQSVLGNPLADPYIMGLSSGACLGAALAVMLPGAGGVTMTFAAFLGAAVCAVAVLVVARRYHDSGILLIFGVILGFAVSAVVALVQSFADAESFKAFYGWMSGSFSMTGYEAVAVMAVFAVLGFTIAYSQHRGLDMVLFGDDYVSLCGKSPSRIRFLAILSCCLLTASVTAFCGPVGFVGIVAPHLVRRLARTSVHSLILPLSMPVGAVLTVTADIFARVGEYPVPVSATMALLGAPVVLYVLLKRS